MYKENMQMYQHMHNAYEHDKIVDKHMFLCGVKREHIKSLPAHSRAE